MKYKRNNYSRAVIPSVIIAAVLAVAVALVLVKAKVLPSKAESTVSDTAAPTESVPSPTYDVVDVTDENTTENTGSTEENTMESTEPSSEKETISSTEAPDGETVWATAYVNVRTGPGTDYEKVGHLETGESVKRLEKGEEWSKVEYKGEVCYVSNKYLTTRNLSPTEESTEAPTEESTQEPTGNENTTQPENTGSGRNVIDPSKGNWNLVIVNAYNEYDPSYKPKLKEVCPGMGYDRYLDERAADHFTDMYKAAKNDGITLTPVSGYRSYALQEKNWKARIQSEKSKGYSEAEAVKRASEVILPPGTSEHNLGIAMDICSLYDSFANTKEYKWLCENAEDYGFILRYKAEWKSKTGIVPEPWHWRYVGVENAKKINESGLCLEDYVAKYA